MTVTKTHESEKITLFWPVLARFTRFCSLLGTREVDGPIKWLVHFSSVFCAGCSFLAFLDSVPFYEAMSPGLRRAAS
jgi:hypothetical protein